MTPTLAERARSLAARVHAGQTYGLDRPYEAHLLMVVGNLYRSGFTDEEIIAAGWLHDSVEDTPLTLDEIRRDFGDGVADLVGAVTSEPGKNRRERNEATYPKIVAGGVRAVALKLSDREANGEFCWSTRDPKLFMYLKEYAGFRGALYGVRDPRLDAVWSRLDTMFGWYDATGRRGVVRG